MTTFAAIILAAGRGTRFAAAGGHQPSKLLAPWLGQPLVRNVALAALGSRAAPVVLVTGHEGGAVAQAVADLPLAVVHNPAYADGLSSTLRAGLAALPPSCPGCVVLLADMPGVTSAIVDALIAGAAAHQSPDAVVPMRDGRRGNPVLLGRSLFESAATLTGDTGARHLLRGPSLRVIEVPIDDDAILADVDLPEHLRPVAARL